MAARRSGNGCSRPILDLGTAATLRPTSLGTATISLSDASTSWM
ncbi:hypothetical protein [Phyllobacterium bourgognense]|nr:hypothetical protein [Phyllobacterium bourgognense]